VAGRFPLYSDADVDGPVVFALKGAGWDIMRAIDTYPEKTTDPVHFERAAREERVLLSNDKGIPLIAQQWLAAGRTFRGVIWWPRSIYDVMTPGGFVQALEELAAQDDPFRYPIIYLKAPR
jgi:hypothetical protein